MFTKYNGGYIHLKVTPFESGMEPKRVNKKIDGWPVIVDSLPVYDCAYLCVGLEPSGAGDSYLYRNDADPACVDAQATTEFNDVNEGTLVFELVPAASNTRRARWVEKRSYSGEIELGVKAPRARGKIGIGYSSGKSHPGEKYKESKKILKDLAVRQVGGRQRSK